MRNAIYIVLMLAVALASCTKDYPLNREPIEDMLTVQANLHSADSEHRVFVSVSGSSGVERVGESAIVRCTVNGVDVPVRLNEMWNIFEFEYEFEPGDEVRLDVEYEGMHAYSEAIVPQRIEMELVDTVRRVEYYGADPVTKSTEIFLKVRMNDRPGKNLISD